MRLFVVILAISLSNVCFGQFDPAGGKPGSHAVHRDNASISYWGDSVEVVRGNQRINASTPIPVITGDENDALGPADDRTISLGDGGQATYVFDREVSNIDGPDFVVFENGFEWAGGYFLELGFVEVSSDGKRFVRFPAECAADSATQIENLSYMECEWYNNLAGKHQSPYGTPFDLESLKDSADIDVNAITHIRLIDVVGSINDSFARRDVKGRKINDPWPTDFESGGFDIDAVGVLQFPLSAPKQGVIKRFVNPNPSVSTNGFDVNMKFTTLTVYSLAGTVLYTDQSGERHLNPGLQEGLFIVKINTATGTFIQKICVVQ